MNTGYSSTHAIEIISENVRFTDCGVKLGIYDGSVTDGHIIMYIIIIQIHFVSIHVCIGEDVSKL